MKVATTLFSLSTPRRKREEVLDHFRKTLRMHELLVNKLSVERRGLIDYAYEERSLPSGHATDFVPQDRINIRNLNLDSPHFHQFIVCRVLTGSYQMSTIMTVVEDPLGDVERLCVGGWADGNRSEALNLANRSYIPIGSILALKNPSYVKSTDGYPLIRIGRPADLIVLNNHHPVVLGISWAGGPSKRIPGFERNSPKLKRYLVSSAQSTPTSRSNSMNLVLTPQNTSNGRSGRRHGKKGKKNKSGKELTIFTLLTNTRDHLSDRDSAILLAFCFCIFVTYLFW